MSRLRIRVGVALGAIAAVSILSTSKEQRNAAAARLKRYNWLFATVTLLIWSLILFT